MIEKNSDGNWVVNCDGCQNQCTSKDNAEDWDAMHGVAFRFGWVMNMYTGIVTCRGCQEKAARAGVGKKVAEQQLDIGALRESVKALEKQVKDLVARPAVYPTIPIPTHPTVPKQDWPTYPGNPWHSPFWCMTSAPMCSAGWPGAGTPEKD